MPASELDRTQKVSYSVSPVRQGVHNFYTLTMPTEILAATSFVSSRKDDPKEGFQRLLDLKRAQEIADYIDAGGTIPNSIVLSAQAEAQVEIKSRKSMAFLPVPTAFLVLDGQHRVYGFALAKTVTRVPVVVYNGLTRKQESQLFIDINTNQKPVPSELLYDIRSLAGRETNEQQQLREIFDYFNAEPDSPLLGLMSAAEKTKGKITRVTFNAAIQPLIKYFPEKEPFEVYQTLASYTAAYMAGLAVKGASDTIVSTAVFKSAFYIFPDIARRVKDKFGEYNVDNFFNVMATMFNSAKANVFIRPDKSYIKIGDHLLGLLKNDFTI